MRRSIRGLAVLACGAVLLASCDIRTATAPTGDLTLYATFDDVEDLTAGHNVQASNVVVGSVRAITLDGHRARVRMSIADGRQIPVGTSAVIRHTSVLGEAFVDLVFPAQFHPDDGPFLEDDAEITDSETQQGIEQLASQAAGIVAALADADVGELLDAGATALDGRGEVLNQLIGDAGAFLDGLAGSTGELAAAIDELARLGGALAPEADRIAGLVDQLAGATGAIATSRDRAVATVEALIELASATSAVVLGPHGERIESLLSELRPLLGFLAERSDVLAGLVTDLRRFTDALPTAVHDGQVLLHTWAFVDVDALVSSFSGLDPVEALRQLLEGGS